MKKLTQLLAAVLLSCGLFVSILTLDGCATANKTAYKGASSVQLTVEAAMNGWGAWIANQDAQGTPVSMDQRAKVKAAYEKYQAAAVLVADAGKGYSLAQSSTNASASQTVLNTAISIASSSLADLVALIQSFGVKL